MNPKKSYSPKFDFKFDKSTGILFKYYYGKISIETLITSWEENFNSDILKNDIKGFILDYTNASLEMDISEHLKIVQFYKSNLTIFGNYKIAVITNNPKDIVIPILVQSKDEGYASKPFSTIEGAIEWVLK
ncbi:hypothetical protein [Urechidicola croceus]|uniref:STAS/SEC14 domain-containing protein n=1 Tax=Urechidicola croceus TaxID=1850246 RepID=A0A1D8P5K3_9FLAO|nr:hypothetical protein [Urechidicola croceus]AOW19856.1 hypothetical protein LPB138_03770 [Urechidicola croceus]